MGLFSGEMLVRFLSLTVLKCNGRLGQVGFANNFDCVYWEKKNVIRFSPREINTFKVSRS